ncbi:MULTISPECIES: hypothetical protein [Thiomicrorhabdus]|uniref:Uncharacterized protein n=1 Tax=Thiomicrorhabdus heinhorstiae TaxID=2748010 RepID=A0ABS0BZ68_9GAMM|nr:MULTISPECIES: hypothetical protein [Thiomicrorhabdus]MBF6059085.1 hypothetical protein [Thiomicrorhabdus heinhorstiae]
MENDQIEYLFFDLSLAQRFQSFCHDLGLSTELEADETHMGESSYSVKLSDDIEESISEQLEAEYDDLLFGEQAAQIDGNDEDGALADACGVQVKLKSGIYTTVAIHPEIMNKILSVLSIDELQQFLAQVAEDIEEPKTGPICSRRDLPTI